MRGQTKIHYKPYTSPASNAYIPVSGVVLVFDDGSSFGAHEIQDCVRPFERRVVRRTVPPQSARPDVGSLVQEELDDARAVRL